MHIPVMANEVLTLLAVKPGGRYIDGTLGSAGHAAAILTAAGAAGSLLGIDRDPVALKRAAENLKDLSGTATLRHGDHGDIDSIAREAGFVGVDGILIDLGVSSDQLDTPQRGFSFQADGPLDMRMDTTRGETAAELLARVDEPALIAIFHNLGEEPQASRAARAIIRARSDSPISTTSRLADVVSTALGGRRTGRHPATRVFQALRMAVNDELRALERALEAGIELLAPNGRMVIITFESLTDRTVKQSFAAHAGREISLYQGGSTWEGKPPQIEQLTRRPLVATAEEVTHNPRSRSAKVRAVRRLPPAESNF